MSFIELRSCPKIWAYTFLCNAEYLWPYNISIGAMYDYYSYCFWRMLTIEDKIDMWSIS